MHTRDFREPRLFRVMSMMTSLPLDVFVGIPGTPEYELQYEPIHAGVLRTSLVAAT